MKNQHSVSTSDLLAESESINQEIVSLKKELADLKNVVNANKDVLFELLEVLKSAKIPYRTE
jgi:hypothetical protein